MPEALTQVVDAQSRVTLPKAFAKSKVVLEEVGPGEIRIRKARRGRGRQALREETPLTLSDADRDRFLQIMESTQRPNAALRRLMSQR